MAKIKQILEKMCPNGVKFRKLGEICEINTGTQLNKDLLTDEGEYPVMNGGSSPSGFHDAYNVEANSIAISQGGASAGFVNWMSTPYWAGAHCYTLKFKEGCDELLTRFLYFVLKNNQDFLSRKKRGAGIPGLPREVLRDFEIPVPPLSVQREIVSVLDRFTDLEAELEAELEARRQQYAFYREQLLAIDAPTRTLGEIGTFVRGNGLQKKDFVEEGVPCIHYGQIYTYYGTSATKTKTFVSPELAKRLKKAQSGDLVIALTSENVEDVCKAVAWLGDGEIAISGDACIFSHKQNPKYIAYYFQTDAFFQQKKRMVSGTKVMRVSRESLAKITIPLPPLSEQSRIVDILDRFDALTTSLTEGLPAEIEARRQQYAYYREQLLHFEPLH